MTWTTTRDWESAELVAAGLQTGPGMRVLVPLGAGDTALGLAMTGAEVLASVTDRADRALWELKLAGRHLERLEHLQLFGLESAGRRVFLYHRVRDLLSAEARAFWNEREEDIRLGLLARGQVEQVLARMRTRVPLAHRRPTVQALFACDTAERARFVRQRWQGPRWTALVAWTVRALPLPRPPPTGWLVQRLERVMTEGPWPNSWLETALLGLPRTSAVLPPFLHPAGHGQLTRGDAVRLVEQPLAALVSPELDGVHLGSLPVPDGLADRLRPGARVSRWCLPGDSRDVPGLERIVDGLAPHADPIGVRGDLVVWRR